MSLLAFILTLTRPSSGSNQTPDGSVLYDDGSPLLYDNGDNVLYVD